MTLVRIPQYGGLHFGQKDVSALGIKVVPTDPPAKWKLQMTEPGGGNLQQDPATEMEDLIVALEYEWE